MTKYLHEEEERTVELQQLLDERVEVMRRRWAEGKDIWTGETLEGEAAEDFLRWQFNGNEPDDLTDAEVEEILGRDTEEYEFEQFMQLQTSSAILSYLDTDDHDDRAAGGYDFGPRAIDVLELQARTDDSDARRVQDEVAAVCAGRTKVQLQSPVRLRHAPTTAC